MPRPNRTRSLFAERHVAANVARLRVEQDPPWSIEGLAERMGVVGCPIHPSALYKLEKGDPPRRVTVDELVAFSLVFGTPMNELIRDPAELVPAEFVDLQERILLQLALSNQLKALLDEANTGLDELNGQWSALIKKARPEDRPKGPVVPLGNSAAPNDAIARQMALAQYETDVDKILRTAIRNRLHSRSTKRRGK